jgi:hypothetical protein
MKKLIRKVLNEERTKQEIQDRMKKLVFDLGWKTVVKMLGGFDNFYTKVFNDDYNEFLELYSNLEVIDGNRESYKSKEIRMNGHPLIIFNIKDKEDMISKDKIWTFFENFGWDKTKIEKFLISWLKDTYEFTAYQARPYSTLSPNNENL